ncbi:DUF3221 domain-containing protein [Domibacillus indicus]|uniref:DUF3221 domain-containing protein n=1 Tax=Domibacillus indicus TaxID=1437523 RepID=UPI0006965EC6|nr:DUF3221 domain-containing protein [Domibacillus indicus]
MKKLLLVTTVLLAACQPADQGEPDKEPAAEAFNPKNHIIAELEQTTENTAVRDEAFKKVQQNETLTGGYLGEVTPELEEEFGVQSIEAEAVQQAIREVYGSISGVGVFFLGTSSDEKSEPGVWVGIKDPDERFDQLVSRLQKQVDEGRILVKYVHLFQSDFTEQESNDLMKKAASALDRAARSHPTPDRVAYSVSVDVRTGVIEVGHDFLTEEAKQGIESQFPGQDFHYTQEGRMVPLPGEPDVEYPEPAVTDKPQTNGSWVMSVSKKGLFVMGAASADFSAGGGEEEHYGATSYSFPEADKKVKVGQRVLVEASGPIMESYPGRGRAKFITVLPAYQPEKADLTEEEAVRAAIQKRQAAQKTEAIRHVKFDEQTDQWTITFVDTMRAKPAAVDIVIADQNSKTHRDN